MPKIFKHINNDKIIKYNFQVMKKIVKHLYRGAAKVTFDDRCEKYGQKPVIFWFTGLSGAGKSTIADEFEKQLFDRGYIVFSLDADDLRNKLNSDLGFSLEDRAENVRRAAETARLLQDAGVIVLASFISPARAFREEARRIARKGMFLEIFVKASLETCITRDPKGFYKKAMDGEIKDYTGIASEYEAPDHADLVLDTDNDSVEICVNKLLHLAISAGVIKKE
jgi:adenylyl-sulfate kinase